MSLLSNIRVLDMSRILAGPWCGQILADLGAEVIKVERPGTGDDTRGWGPPYVTDKNGQDTSESAYYLSANRGKKSITIDISSKEGQALIYELAEKSDVILENYKVGGLAKYNLDYASLKEINPRLIYCSITGFGQTGPYSHRPGYDFLIQAMGGLMSITGESDSQPGGGPQKVGVALADILTGVYATVATLAALFHRSQTGEGQHIDLALLDVQVAVLANQALNYLVSGDKPERIGNHHPNVVPYQSFSTSDTHIIIAVGNDSQFSKFCDVIERSELSNDERFKTNKLRVQNRNKLSSILAPELLKKTSKEWISLFEGAGVPCGPINSIDEVFDNPQIKYRGLKLSMNHSLAGQLNTVANPIRFSNNPINYDLPPPLLGEHTNDILSQLLDLNEDKINDLKLKKVI